MLKDLLNFTVLAAFLVACSASESPNFAKKSPSPSSPNPNSSCGSSQHRPTSEIKVEIDQLVGGASCEVDSDCKTEVYDDGSVCQPALVHYSSRQTNERALFALLEEYSDSARACNPIDPSTLQCPAVVFEIPKLKCPSKKVCEVSHNPSPTSPSEPMPPNRLITEGCSEYYDGCNDCGVQENGQVVCTQRACVHYTEPYCKQINQNKCASWYDGCNSCAATSSGGVVCTNRYCEPNQYSRPYCKTLR